VAAAKAFFFITLGSQMNKSYVLPIPKGLWISTPNRWPFWLSIACFYLNLLRTSTESKPALSAIFLGMVSKLLAKALTIS